MNTSVYLNRIASHLSYSSISNDDMELYSRLAYRKIFWAKSTIPGHNGIKIRYYALKQNHAITHSNANLTKISIDSRNLSDNRQNLMEVSFTQNFHAVSP